MISVVSGPKYRMNTGWRIPSGTNSSPVDDISGVSAETITTGWWIPSGTNSSPVDDISGVSAETITTG
jgi:hypothetical protein